MNAEIIAVGTEILLGQITNTNARYLSEQLAVAGVNVFFHQVVGDNMKRLTDAISLAQSRSDLIFLCGGLGPTEDDLTREALAAVLGRSLELDERVLEQLVQLFARLGREMTPNNRQQAMRIQGALILDNPRGTAPGQYVEAEGRHYVLLPGPPTEMIPMFVEQVLPLLHKLSGESQTIRNRVLRIFGLGEPAVETKVADLLESTNPTIASYASEGECKLRVTAKADSVEAADDLIAGLEMQVRERLGGFIYGVDDEKLPVVVGKQLIEKGLTLAVYEGVTGGVLTSMLHEYRGVSSYIKEAMVLADGELLKTRLGLREYKTLEERAGVIAEAMRRYAGADWAVAVSDLVTPNEGSAAANMRDVYFAVSGPQANDTKVVRIRGDQTQLRIRAAKHALHLLIQSMEA
ncbi:competence/damage-inducible protein A [Tumebacillus sp. ITR2]|uniref:Putative competence-damage inducible protein n=1 Tax=Tumebacillus amylolyticus TaxID=2801339 RepID=A0ABS1J840_9BACL|nr:competence/damage-inducible protein A [Tumebacillus amylolyticus]